MGGDLGLTALLVEMESRPWWEDTGKRLPQVPSSTWQGAQIKAAWLGQAAPEVHVAVVDPTSHQLPHPPTA